MKFINFFKSMLALGVLVCMAGTASAQNDLDVKNATGCDFYIKFIQDDGSGTCTTYGFGNGFAAGGTFNTFSTGVPSGQPYLVGVGQIGMTSIRVGDCSLTSCSCLGLPSTNTINACGNTYTIDFYPPGVITANAFVYIY